MGPSLTSRDRYLQRKYKITEAQYELLLAAHDGNCWICGRPPKKQRLHVEHDHHTGRVRGLACWRCNRGLQTFSDDPGRLRRAADYLESDEADRILERDTDATT
jgi:hypothetical protein